MAPPSHPPKPLSENEWDQLADWLATTSPLDLDGLLGLLHAVAVAPSLIPPSAWLAVVLPEGLAKLEHGDVQPFLGLLFRLHGEVQDAVSHLQALIPETEDVAEWESFASGYAAGAELDAEWTGNADRWTFAAGFAYVGNRLDLLTQKSIDDIERNLGPDPKAALRRNLGAVIRATEESFSKVRRRTMPPSAAPTGRANTRRVKRNEPCPCGSGKKYKRCCIDSPTQAESGLASPLTQFN